jgi:serine/threonine-protein kinase
MDATADLGRPQVAETVPPSAIGGLDLPSKLIGEYEVEGLLGQGGFGSVYSAVHPLIGKRVAIKVLNQRYSSDRDMVSRFIAEARAVNQIGHRNIIDVFSFGALPDGRQYYIMELLKGVSLSSYLRTRGKLTPAEAFPLLREIGRALDAAHAKHIFHRDLKPDNIFIADDEGQPFPKLLDFGLAKLVDDEDVTHKTRSGSPMGTPMYMSPEQCRGRNVDHRTDIYAFGIMTYQLLTGQVPFDGDDFVAICMKQMNDIAPKPSSIVPSLSPAIDAGIARMIEKSADKRPSTIAEALAAMGVEPRSDATGPVIKTPPADAVGALISTGPSHAAGESIGQPAKPRRTLWIAIAGVALAGGIAIFAATRGGTEPAQTPAPPPSPTVAITVPIDAPIAIDAPALPTTVEITLELTPRDAQIVDAHGTSLDIVNSKLVLPRGDAAIDLTIKHAGFASKISHVTPNQNSSLKISLVPNAAPQHRSQLPDLTENHGP